jgi:putative PIG3 family NAD(P)H quinone oxidoreductase
MRAVVSAGNGGPEVLSWGEVPDLPAPGPGEVLLDVAATALNRADLLQRQGFYPPPPGASEVIGMECSGVVSAIGADVAGWSVGDEVCALLAGGGYAEQVLVSADQLLPVPAGLSLQQAAALPEVACTVWSNVVDRGALGDGDWLLVHGGSGGIGTMAIQVARVLGAHAAVTAGSAEKLERCRALGAELLIDYKQQDFVAEIKAGTDGRGADVILDNMGAKYLSRNVDALAEQGRLIIIGLQGGTRAELDIAKLLMKRGSVHATAMRSRNPADKARIVAGTVRDLWPAVADGRIVAVIDQVFPIADVAEAHRLLEGSSHVGKVVLAVR